MSTFIVRFVGDTAQAFRGRVRHVATGEEAGFASPAELLAFLEGMNAVSGLGTVPPQAKRLDVAGRPRPHDLSTDTGAFVGNAHEEAARDGGQP